MHNVSWVTDDSSEQQGVNALTELSEALLGVKDVYIFWDVFIFSVSHFVTEMKFRDGFTSRRNLNVFDVSFITCRFHRLSEEQLNQK